MCVLPGVWLCFSQNVTFYQPTTYHFICRRSHIFDFGMVAFFRSFLGYVFEGIFCVFLCFSVLRVVHFWNHFVVFFNFLGYVFKHRFLLSSRAHFSEILVVFWPHFLTCFCNWSHLWFSWFLTTLPVENSFFTGLTASLSTHFVVVFSTSFQMQFLTWFSQLLKPFRCPFCSKKR